MGCNGSRRDEIDETYLEQALAVLSTPRADDLQSGDGAVPRCVVLRVLSGNTSSRAVRTAEDDRTWDVSARHVVRLSGRVDDLVDGLHGKVPCHEFATGRSEV